MFYFPSINLGLHACALLPHRRYSPSVMADMLLNLDTAGGQSGEHAKQGNHKHQQFLKKRRYLEKKGFLKQKQLPPKPPNKDKRASSEAPSRQNGQQRTERSHCNLFCPRQLAAPAALSRTTAGKLSVSIGPNHARLAKYTPSRGHCSSTLGAAKSDGASRPEPKPALHLQNVDLLSEFESGIPAVSSAPSYKMVAIDCEMVGTGMKGSISALARCSIVGYHGDVVYDKYVKPANPVTDYRTKWSGIRREHLINAIPFATAQREILKILHGKIVIGHAIHNDYKALGYVHPKEMTRDTSKITLLNRKAGFPEKEMASLKRLAKQLLRKDIQTGRGGHSSVEDAKTTMELYRMVEAEYERQLASGQAHV